MSFALATRFRLTAAAAMALLLIGLALRRRPRPRGSSCNLNIISAAIGDAGAEFLGKAREGTWTRPSGRVAEPRQRRRAERCDLTGAADVAAAGFAPMLKLWDRTKNNIKVNGIARSIRHRLSRHQSS